MRRVLCGPFHLMHSPFRMIPLASHRHSDNATTPITPKHHILHTRHTRQSRRCGGAKKSAKNDTWKKSQSFHPIQVHGGTNCAPPRAAGGVKLVWQCTPQTAVVCIGGRAVASLRCIALVSAPTSTPLSLPSHCFAASSSPTTTGTFVSCSWLLLPLLAALDTPCIERFLSRLLSRALSGLPSLCTPCESPLTPALTYSLVPVDCSRYAGLLSVLPGATELSIWSAT